MDFEITKIREAAGLNKRKFSDKYSIPYRTLQNWELGVTDPPAYLIPLLVKAEAMGKVAPMAWVLTEYRDTAGYGTDRIFADKHEAIREAMTEWDHLSYHDQKSYRDDPGAWFYVGLFKMTWDDYYEEFTKELDPEIVAWDALAEK